MTTAVNDRMDAWAAQELDNWADKIAEFAEVRFADASKSATLHDEYTDHP